MVCSAQSSTQALWNLDHSLLKSGDQVLQLSLAVHRGQVPGPLRIQPTTDYVVLYVFIGKNPRINGPMQFKPMLFEGQL